jgi:hypothetical protein
MRTPTMTYLKTNVTLTLLTLAIACLFASCSNKMTFEKSAVVPSAEGTVQMKKDGNNNYTIDLALVRLADPSRLTPPKAAYFVWMETAENGVKNIGQLKTSSGLFSKSLKSSLKTVTPFEPTGFFITGEESTSVQYPGPLVIMRTIQL